MVLKGDSGALADIQAVEEGYPLRGKIQSALNMPAVEKRIPHRGDVWPDAKLAARLNLVPGDRIALGNMTFKIGTIIKEEPESAVGLFNLAPRLLMNLDDVEKTGLVQTGSRVRYSLLVAGSPEEVAEFRRFAETKLDRGQRLQDVKSARPEVRSALERAEKFLGLAALSSVMLAAAAIALSARRYVQRHLDQCALMRCVGASQNLIVRLYVKQFALFGLAASGAGCILGAIAQQGLAALLAPLVGTSLPLPSIAPAAGGFAAGFLLLIGFALPPVLALRRVPALRVLRRELGVHTAGASYAFGIVLIIAAIVWQADDIKLVAYVLGGMAGIVLASAALAWLFFALARRIESRGLSWRYGLVSLRRRKLGTVVQVSALGLGAMALLTLTVVRDDLLRNWQSTVPADAPNRFLVNVQPDQLPGLSQFFARKSFTPPEFFPMVRGRLVAINGGAVSSDNYGDERAKRLIDREFNLSWAEQLDNAIVTGAWLANRDKPSLSVEQGIAETLGIGLGDELTYDIAGSQISAPVTSLRKVDWDSFRVNFFVIAEPGLLETFPASYVTSFYLPPADTGLMPKLLREFPNILVIDVEAILASVQEMMRQVRHAVQFVFLFTLLAGLAVLYSAITLTAEERHHEASLLRALGALRRELKVSLAAEFAALGALAGLVGALGTTVLTYVLATRVFSLPFTPNYWIWVAGIVLGALVVAVAGILGARAVLDAPPLGALRDSN